LISPKIAVAAVAVAEAAGGKQGGDDGLAKVPTAADDTPRETYPSA
jgi:hypothetical protein